MESQENNKAVLQHGEKLHAQLETKHPVVKIGIQEGDWYFYDPTKKRGEYDRGEWIQIQLAARLSDKELHTTSIGKMSFTATDGTDDGDYEHAESTMRLITDAGNTANKCGLLPSELLEQRDELLRTGLSFLDKYLNLSYKGSDDPLEKEVKEFSSAFRKISG